MKRHCKGDNGENRYIHQFDSLVEFVLAADAGKDSKDGASCHTWDTGWAGTPTFADAVKLARHGWSDIRPQLDAALTPVREKLAEKLDLVAERHHDLTGYEPDIDRYLSGELECMWEDMLIEAPKMGKVHTLHISGAVNSNVSPETMAKRGAALVALCEAFTICGAELEIWLELSVQAHNNDTWSALVRVQRAGELMDINSLMFPLAHPSMLRRLTFGLMESEATKVRETFGFSNSGGYGSARDFLCADMIEASFQMSMGGGSSGREIDKNPVAWVLQTLEDQGVYAGSGF